ncbi:MAG: TetR/AcrR family transcriptional regulator [Suipraeoptans sp.]
MRQIEKNVSPQSNDKRNAYVIDQITKSFLELLAEMPIDEISISELTNKAGVSRASFYRNFKRKEDILILYISNLFCEWTDEWKKNHNAPLSEQVRTMIEHFENHRIFYTMLYNHGLTYMLKDIIIGSCGQTPDSEMIQAYASSFAAYTLYGWIDTWFQRGMKESSEEIYAMFKAQGL